MAGELVLLTGGTGFLGYTILVQLLQSGYRVRAAARSQAKIDRVRAAPTISALDPSTTQLTFVIVPDMTAIGAYDTAVQGVDFVIHAAAPVHTDAEGSTPSKEELEESLITTTVKGALGILKSAKKEGKAVRRVIMTSSTVAIAPAEIYTTDTKERDVVRGPDSRVAIPESHAAYESELHAYCVGKAAALNASEAFIRDKATSFDLISIIPSWIFGKDELITNTQNIPRGSSTNALIGGLLTGKQGVPSVGNAVLCADVARAHVKSLDAKIEGNQSFLVNAEAKWEDTIPIVKQYFPDAFRYGLFREGTPQPTIPLKWDSSKVCAGNSPDTYQFETLTHDSHELQQTRNILGINIAGYDTMVKEVVGQYLELAKREDKYL